jgi:hypothetical protein
MKCANCHAVLSGEPTCPTCGTVYTVSSAGASIPALVEELERRLTEALEGRYELRGLLGHGGMGAVFLAVELRLDRLVAIKVLPPSLSLDHEVLTRFEREARTAARLDHPGIVPIYSVEDVDGLHFYVMKFVPGGDLSDVLTAGPMDSERARQITWEAAQALGHAHTRGVIHRDVKPANIMLDPGGRALVADFGIAKAVRSGTQMTSTGQMIGTPQYMSPEQMEGREVDGRADQYSLGMVAWHMLAGRQPFEGGSVASLLVKQLHEYPESLAVLRPEIPDDMVGAIERAIRKDPEQRFESMEAFAHALRPQRSTGVASSGAEGAYTAPRSSRPVSPSGRRWVVAAALAVAVAGGIAGRALLRGGASPSPTTPGEVLDGVGQAVQGIDERVDEAMAGLPDVVPPAGGPEGAVEAAPGIAVGGAVLAETVGGDTTSTTTQAAPATEPQAGSVGDARSTGGDPAAQVAAAPPVGYLTVGATPDYGYVEIDGVELPNPTPIFEHPLAPGSYVVSVRREGYVTVVDTVEITSGNVTRRNVVLVRN